MATNTQNRIRAVAAAVADATPKPAQAGAYGIAPEGFRLPAQTRIGRVRLQVADLERSLAYYGQVLGFRVIERGDDRAVLGAHGSDTPLVELRVLETSGGRLKEILEYLIGNSEFRDVFTGASLASAALNF